MPLDHQGINIIIDQAYTLPLSLFERKVPIGKIIVIVIVSIGRIRKVELSSTELSYWAKYDIR